MKVAARECKGCSKVFRPQRNRHGTYCSRDCAFANKATTEWKEGNPRADEPAVRNIKAVSRWVTRIQKRYKQVVVQCGMCRRSVGWPSVGVRGSMSPQKYCRRCSPHMRTLGSGYSGLRSPICMVCQRPRNWGPKTMSGKRCEACEKAHRTNRRRGRGRSHRKRCRAVGSVYDPKVTLIGLIQQQGPRCRICEKMTRPDWNYTHNLYPSIDHIVPISKGGSHTMDNVQVAHRICNGKKSAKLVGQRLLW